LGAGLLVFRTNNEETMPSSSAVADALFHSKQGKSANHDSAEERATF